MIGPWTAMAWVLLTLAGLFGLLKLMERTLRPHPELTRKLLHVGMGLVVLTFPWVFHDAWPVLWMAGISAVLLTIVKRVPSLRDGVGSILTRVKRPSLGEVCYPVAVGLLFLMSRGDKLLFTVPMLIMTLADTMAALVGIVYGKVRYVTSDGLKSAEGSVAFFCIAFLSVHVPLLLYTAVGRAESLLVAVVIGLLSMLLEAIAWRGLDNLLIPLGAFAFLRLYLHADIDALLLRLYATLGLLVFALAWRRRTSLDDSALMVCALFGYGAWMLGGLDWLIAPTLLFLVHVTVWPRAGKDRVHTVYAVLSVIVGGLLWLGLHVAYNGGFLFPYAVCFGAHMAIIGVSRIAVDPGEHRKGARVAYSVLTGCLITGLQIIPLLARHGNALPLASVVRLLVVSICCIMLAAGIFFLLLPVLYGSRRSNFALHSAGLVSGLVASGLAAGMQTI